MIKIEKFGYSYTFIFSSQNDDNDVEDFIYALNNQSDLICDMNGDKFTVKFVKSDNNIPCVFKKHYMILYLDAEYISDIAELLQAQGNSFVLDIFFSVKTIKNKTVDFFAYSK